MLKEKGVLCPEPIAAVRSYSGLLITGSMLLLEWLSDIVRLDDLLMEDAERASRLIDDALQYFICLREKGVFHGDLHWENILMKKGKSPPEFYLVDALYVRFPKSITDEQFAYALARFAHYMKAGGAPQEIIDIFLRKASKVSGYSVEWLRRTQLAVADKLGVRALYYEEA